MKEIDLLPKWYKSGKRRQSSYRTQYIALGGIFAVMMVWNFITTHSISKTEAKLARETARLWVAESVSAEFAEIKSEVIGLQKRVKSIGEIDSKIDVTSVLAEMSFLIDETIVLSKVELLAESFAGRQAGKAQSGSAVRAARSRFGGRGTPPVGDVRFKVVISGIASNASNVAALICKLEDSPYFCQVIPSFSRNRNIKEVTELAGEDYQVSEFEISCYLANYKETIIDS